MQNLTLISGTILIFSSIFVTLMNSCPKTIKTILHPQFWKNMEKIVSAKFDPNFWVNFEFLMQFCVNNEFLSKI